jgi:hypothetical protein
LVQGGYDIIYILIYLRGRVVRMEDKILKAIESLKENFNQKIDSAVDGLRKDMDVKFDSLSEKVDNQSNQLKENTQILKALEHLAEVNKSEHDKMFFNRAEMSGEIKNMRKDLSTVELMTANNWGDIAKLKSVK